MSGGEGSFLISVRDADSDWEGVREFEKNQSISDPRVRQDEKNQSISGAHSTERDQSEISLENHQDKDGNDTHGGKTNVETIEKKHDGETQKEIVDLTEDHNGSTREGRTHLSHRCIGT